MITLMNSNVDYLIEGGGRVVGFPGSAFKSAIGWVCIS